MIEAGLPDDRDGWPDGVLEGLRAFAQGDVVPAPPLFYFADPGRPVWQLTHDAALEVADIVASDDSFLQYCLITSQTCDIAEEDADVPRRPFVQLCPVYDGTAHLDPATCSLLKKAKGPGYLIHLPAMSGGFWVADLRLEFPVEKGWLAGQTRTAGFETEAQQQLVGDKIARMRSRPALSGQFVKAIHRPLVEALQMLRSTDRDAFVRLRTSVAEVRAALDSALDTRTVQLLVLGAERIPGDVKDWFDGWWGEQIAASASSGLSLLSLRISTLNELSAAEYLATVPVDLERFSPH